jgi:glycine/D-amino acid oxidase-like deaminating enzyme
LTSHASGHNAGGISAPHVSQSNEIWSLEEHSSKLYQALGRKKGFNFDYTVTGSILLYTKDEDTVPLKSDLEKFRTKSHANGEFLTKSEVKEKEPSLSVENISGAYYYPDDAQGSSVKLGHCFATACIDKGVKISTGTELAGFEVTNGKKKKKIDSVLTNKGHVHPKTVVIAAGPWSGRIASMAGMNVPIEPVKGHLIITPKAKEKIVHSFILGPNYYFLQSHDRSIVIGGGEDSVGFDENLIGSRVQEAWNESSAFLPVIKSLGQESRMACLRPYCTDNLPVIGNSTQYDNLIFATGHFRSGFSLAPVTGKIVSELIVEGDTKTDIKAFSPGRFSA